MLKLLPMSMLLLGGCATAGSSGPACPREVEYSREFQARLADETIAAGATVQAAMVDYGKLRAQTRACRGG